MTLYLKMECGTNSWIPFLWMNDLHIVTRLCKQITRFHVFGTKGPMVLDWGVASVCGSPRSVQAVPMKKWLQHESAWIEWQALFQTLLSKYELGPSLSIQAEFSVYFAVCIYCGQNESHQSSFQRHVIWSQCSNGSTEKPLGWAICSEILLAYWSQQLADLDFQHAGEAQSQCRLWSVYRAYMHIVGRDLLWASFTYSKFVHHLK